MIKVLIVEDDPMVAELNADFIKRVDGFKLIDTVANGNKALEYLDKNKVDLILLDVFMPQMDGMQLLQNIRTSHPAVDVIMITAAQSSENIQTALRQGVVDYIIKPFKFPRIQTALISYRERVRILSQMDSLDQSILDQGVLVQDKNTPLPPKGIEKQTMQRIKEIIEQQEKPFSVQDLVPLVGLSRISLRKYLAQLQAEGFISSTLTYKAVGRPVQLYSINKSIK